MVDRIVAVVLVAMALPLDLKASAVGRPSVAVGADNDNGLGTRRLESQGDAPAAAPLGQPDTRPANSAAFFSGCLRDPRLGGIVSSLIGSETSKYRGWIGSHIRLGLLPSIALGGLAAIIIVVARRTRSPHPLGVGR